ncbi:hypothetical protein GW17_00003388 [Ensete ventricosum]|nr:hypothetical protein GW17_00003388 [Ensete ventricosum]
MSPTSRHRRCLICCRCRCCCLRHRRCYRLSSPPSLQSLVFTTVAALRRHRCRCRSSRSRSGQLVTSFLLLSATATTIAAAALSKQLSLSGLPNWVPDLTRRFFGLACTNLYRCTICWYTGKSQCLGEERKREKRKKWWRKEEERGKEEAVKDEGGRGRGEKKTYLRRGDVQ